MKRRVSRRGVHERIQWLSDDGKPLELDWAALSETDRNEIRSVGFAGMQDFLKKAEKLANEQLKAHGFPTDWPRPVKLCRWGASIDAWETPDECEPDALKNAAPNAELAADLKRDVHNCRQRILYAEFHSRPPPPNTIPLTPEQRASELLYFGVIAGLSYWRLLANVRFERAVAEKERRLAASRPVVTKDQIIEALRTETTVTAAAAKLGITDRAIRQRTSAAERKQLRQKRKS